MSTPELNQQLAQIYSELRQLARAQMRHERSNHTLSATALVNEAYLRLLQSPPQWQTPAHFVAIAATVMRQVLVDHARARGAAKRGGDWSRLTLTLSHEEVNALADEPVKAIDVLDLDRALDALQLRDRRQAQLVELRYFGGLSLAETAEVLGVAVATVKRDWLVAKLFLRRELGPTHRG